MTATTAVLPRRPVALLALLLPFMYAPDAAAQVSGRATAGALTFTLTDLDPLDGINPSLVFSPLPYVPPIGSEFEGAMLMVRSDNGDVSDTDILHGSGTASMSKTLRSGDDVGLSISLTGRDQIDTHFIEVDTFARTEGTTVRYSNASGYTGRLEFVLSPHTAVTFNMDYSVTGSVIQSSSTVEYYIGGADLFLALGSPPYMGVASDAVHFELHPRLFIDSEASVDQAGTMFAMLENTSANYVDGHTKFVAYSAAGSGPIPAIPEPSMLHMLATGLIVAGLWRSRQHRQAA